MTSLSNSMRQKLGSVVIAIRITNQEAARLDRLATQRGFSRRAAMRAAVQEWLAREEKPSAQVSA